MKAGVETSPMAPKSSRSDVGGRNGGRFSVPVALTSDRDFSSHRRRNGAVLVGVWSSASTGHGGKARLAGGVAVAAHVNSENGFVIFGRGPPREEEGEVGGLNSKFQKLFIVGHVSRSEWTE